LAHKCNQHQTEKTKMGTFLVENDEDTYTFNFRD
jgi:hypothetical protein